MMLLLALRMSKFDKAFYLHNRKGGESLMKFLDRFPKIVTADNGVRQDARSTHHGPA